MKFGSLFTGVGGFDLGLERAGMECIWQCEIDKYCNQVLEEHWKGVKRYNDVKQITKDNTEVPDIIVGGFPCQDLSVAGKRAGLSGERSGLWFEFERIIGELRPKWVIIENVPGLLSSNKGADFAVILKALDDFGYCVAFRILNSEYFGVAQRRRRVFIVASLGNTSCGQVLFESESVSGNIESSRAQGEGITRTIEAGSYWDGGQISDTLDSSSLVKGQMMPEKRRFPVVYSVREDAQADNFSATELDKANAIGALQPSPQSHHAQTFITTNWDAQRARIHDPNGKAPSLQSGADSSGNITPAVWQMNHASEVYRECWSGQNRLEFNKPISPTLQERMGTGGNNVPLVGVRRLTPVECERLQGFPDGWCSNIVSNSQAYKQMGNAVTTNVITWIGKRIIKVACNSNQPVV